MSASGLNGHKQGIPSWVAVPKRSGRTHRAGRFIDFCWQVLPGNFERENSAYN
jgi:hypothetical protein